MRCIVCRRPLKVSASTAAQIGPKCLERLRAAARRAPKPTRRRAARPEQPADERQLELLEAT